MTWVPNRSGLVSRSVLGASSADADCRTRHDIEPPRLAYFFVCISMNLLSANDFPCK